MRRGCASVLIFSEGLFFVFEKRREKGREGEREREGRLGDGGDTYGSVVDEVWRRRVGVVGVVTVVVVIIIIAAMPVFRVLRWTDFRSWDLDVERGKGFAETGDRGDGAGVSFQS